MKCDNRTDFPKSGHICKSIKNIVIKCSTQHTSYTVPTDSIQSYLQGNSKKHIWSYIKRKVPNTSSLRTSDYLKSDEKDKVEILSQQFSSAENLSNIPTSPPAVFPCTNDIRSWY